MQPELFPLRDLRLSLDPEMYAIAGSSDQRLQNGELTVESALRQLVCAVIPVDPMRTTEQCQPLISVQALLNNRKLSGRSFKTCKNCQLKTRSWRKRRRSIIMISQSESCK